MDMVRLVNYRYKASFVQIICLCSKKYDTEMVVVWGGHRKSKAIFVPKPGTCGPIMMVTRYIVLET